MLLSAFRQTSVPLTHEWSAAYRRPDLPPKGHRGFRRDPCVEVRRCAARGRSKSDETENDWQDHRQIPDCRTAQTGRSNIVTGRGQTLNRDVAVKTLNRISPIPRS
jgi:hypothetical protein